MSLFDDGIAEENNKALLINVPLLKRQLEELENLGGANPSDLLLGLEELVSALLFSLEHKGSAKLRATSDILK